MILVRKTDGKAEFEKHLEIRKAVFQLEQGVPESADLDDFDKKRTAESYLAFYNGEAVGAARWRENRAGFKLERICILKEFRGKGIGKAIVRTLMNEVPKNMPPNLASQADVVPFYKQFGFRARGESFWEGGLLHRYMKYYPECDPEHPDYNPKKSKAT